MEQSFAGGRLDAADAECVRLEDSLSTLRDEAVIAARAAILLGDWTINTCKA